MHLSLRTRGDCAGELLDLLEDEMACGMQACVGGKRVQLCGLHLFLTFLLIGIFTSAAIS